MTETNTNLQNTISTLQAKFETVQRNPTQSALKQLEEQVSDLVTQAVGTPYAGAVESLLTEIIELRRQGGTTPVSISEGEETDSVWQAQFENARGYILFGKTVAEQRQGLRDLQPLLAQRPSDETLLTLLKSAAERDDDLREPIVDLLEHVAGPAAAALRQQLQARSDSSSSSTPKQPYTNPEQRSNREGPMSEQPYIDLEQRIIDLYYEGEYRKALKLCIDLQRQDPENDVAVEYKRKCEQNIADGVVPDARLPLTARRNYYRGLSAVRGSDYQEAKGRFEAALNEARAVGILEWSAGEEALQQAEDGLEAQKLVQKARDARAADQWEEAIDLYQRAQNVFPESVSDEIIKNLSTLSTEYKRLNSGLNHLSGNRVMQATQLKELERKLPTLLAIQPESNLLDTLQSNFANKSQELALALYDDARHLRTLADQAPLDKRVRQVEEAQRILDLAHEINASQTDINRERNEVANDLQQLITDKEKLEEIRQQIMSDEAAAMAQAKTSLGTLSQRYIDEPTIRGQISQLHTRFLQLAERALEQDDLTTAETYLSQTEQAPFNILGGSHPEQRRLQRILKKMQDDVQEAHAASKAVKERQLQRERVRSLLIGGAIISVFLLAFIFSIPSVIMPTFFPTPTFTPTITPTPTMTLTPTPSLTPSITPTSTNTPVPTNTPIPTPTTPPVLCTGFTTLAGLSAIHVRPDSNSARIDSLVSGIPLQIIDISRSGSTTWYKVDYGDENDNLARQGWIEQANVIETSTCP